MKSENLANPMENKMETHPGLEAALALVDFGPLETGRGLQRGHKIAFRMCAYREAGEHVHMAAARIIAAEYRKALEVISALEAGEGIDE